MIPSEPGIRNTVLRQPIGVFGAHMKRVTMELGGHAPSIVFDDADVDLASRLLSTNKLRNAGQVCVSPTRLLVQEKVYDRFVGQFTEAVKAAKIGDGMESGTQMSRWPIRAASPQWRPLLVTLCKRVPA